MPRRRANREYFSGDARKRRWNVYIEPAPEGDENGLYYTEVVKMGRRYDYQQFSPEFAIKVGEQLIAAGRRAQEKQKNRERGGRKYHRLRRDGPMAHLIKEEE